MLDETPVWRLQAGLVCTYMVGTGLSENDVQDATQVDLWSVAGFAAKRGGYEVRRLINVKYTPPPPSPTTKCMWRRH